MYYYVDLTDDYYGPKYLNSPNNAFFYVVYMLIGQMFLMNLFTGVL